jgi:hypothetical protein
MKELTRAVKDTARDIVYKKLREYGHVNGKRMLRAKLRQLGWSELKAAEEGECEFKNVRKELDALTREWNAMGLPSPALQGDIAGEFIGPLHEEYQSKWADSRWCEDFWPTVDSIRDANPNVFLCICAIWLHALGATRIYVTDSANDHGVDLLGVFEDAAGAFVGLAVQAKSSSRRMTPGEVKQEYFKFRDGLDNQQLAALLASKTGMHDSPLAGQMGLGFGVVGAGEVSAEVVAKEYHLFLRSGLQLAYSVAREISHDRLIDFLAKWSSQTKKSKKRNWATIIAKHTRS